MFKMITAGVTALSLTLASATPVQANGLSEEDIGKLLFGLVAAVTLGAAIDNHNDRSDNRRREEAQVQRHRPAPQVLPPRQHRQERNNRRRADDRVLPRECLRSVETRYGEHRMFTRRCLTRNYVFANQLPRQCSVQVWTDRGVRRGYDPQCLRNEGFRARRR